MVFHLLKALLRNQEELQLAVIVLNQGKLASLLEESGVTVHLADETRFTFGRILHEVSRIVRDFAPDLVHSHRYKENLLAYLACYFKRIGLIATQHGLPEWGLESGSLPQRTKLWSTFHLLRRHFTRTVAVSRELRDALVDRFGFPSKLVTVIRNGVELPDVAVPSSGTGPFVIGSSGRLVRVKDYPLFVEVAEKLAGAGEEGFRFELAGEGPEHSHLQSLIGDRGLQRNVILRGHQEDMGAFYRGLDLYLNTSLHEGIPMTVLEALGWGVPVIAPAVGGIPEIIEDGVQGYVIDGRDPERFAEKCRLLRGDAGRYRQFRAAARKRALEEFSVEAMAAGYRDLYLEALSDLNR